MENQIKLSDVPRKQRNFPTLELTEQSLNANVNQPLLVVQSPKTPTLSRKLKAASLDSDPPKQGTHLEVDRDVFSMPNTPKRQIKPKLLCDLDDPSHKFTLTPSFSSNLMRFGSNTSISGSQTLKTLPEIMPLQDFSDNRCEPIRIKAKGLLERRGSNASLTIDLGSNSNIAEVKIPVARLNPAKSVNSLNLTSFGNDHCNCQTKKCADPQPTDKKPPFDRRKSQQPLEKCENCTIYESEPSKTAKICNIECQTFNKKCACLCNYKSRRKSLSNENLYVPPTCCSICQGDANKDCSGLSKGHRRACYPRQADLEASQLLSEDFKFYLQNIQYLQTAGNVLDVEELKSCCETNKIPKIHQEFWEVPLNLQEKCLVPGSQNRNRYRGVLPNEHSRVLLSGPESYIHANYIKGPDYSENAYIATQGPMPHTCEDFWDMVWTSKSNCVVMLTGLIEKGRTKCELYFPLGKTSSGKSYFTVKTTRLQDRFTFDRKNTQQYEEEIVEFEELNEVTFGKYRVEFVAMETLGECEIRRLRLCRHNSERLIYHYWFPNWQDHKMANPEEVLRIALHVVELIDENYQKYKVGNFMNSSEDWNRNVEKTCEFASFFRQFCERTDTRVETRRFSEALNNELSKNDREISIAVQSIERNAKISEKTRKAEPVRRVSSNPLAGNKRSDNVMNPCRSARMIVVDKLGQTRFLRDDVSLSAVSRDNVLDAKKSHDDDAPFIVVHCSAGIGRTGCFLAILNGIQQLKTNGNVDVLAILCSLRLHRGGMVQTAEQYELIHKVLKLYIDSV